MAEQAFHAPSDSIEGESGWKISARQTADVSRTIGFEISLHAMEEIAEQAFQTIRIGINHRAMDSIWTLLTSLYIED